MNEMHFADIEKTLLYISEARERAARTAKELRQNDAKPHLIAALEEAEQQLEKVGRVLMQETYFAVPSEQLSMDKQPVEELTLS
jgi:hypothetical protein